MRKNDPLSFFVLLFLAPFFLGSSAPLAQAEDSSLAIHVVPDQNSVKPGMMFLVSVQVANSASDSSTGFWVNKCSFEKHWVTDDPEVHIQPWTCEENTLEQVTLDPGDAYGKNIILYISGKEKGGPVIFRLGFQRMSENGDIAEPLWSDPVTMELRIPEEIKDAAPAAAADAASQVSGQSPAAPVEINETVSSVMADLTAQEASHAMVFRDPGVPIKVRPGDEFSIDLVSNPSTGFRWKMTLPEGGKAVTFLGSKHVVSEEVMPGVPGTEVFTFKAMTPGGTEAAFLYERPWEPEVAPDRKIFTILVEETQ